MGHLITVQNLLTVLGAPSTERMDGIVALIMALGRAMLPEEPVSQPQIYIFS